MDATANEVRNAAWEPRAAALMHSVKHTVERNAPEAAESFMMKDGLLVHIQGVAR
jgi:hypothetical protein